MKNTTLLFFLISSITFSQVNFTASKGFLDKQVNFHVNSFVINSYKTDLMEWDFGDGNTAIGLNPTHTFANTGTYKVCLRARLKSNNGLTTLCKENVFTITNTGLHIKYLDDYVWPNGSISDVNSPFNYRIKQNQKTYDFHRALDIFDTEGVPVIAIADGIVDVITNKDNPNMNNTRIVSIKHTLKTPMYFHGKVINTLYTRNHHVKDIYVSVGQSVKKGDVIATVGETGSVGTPHNHFVTRIGFNLPKLVMDKPENSSLNNSSNNPFFPNIVDPDVNPLLFLLPFEGENETLKYNITRKENSFYLNIHSQKVQDFVTEIGFKYHKKSDGTQQTISLNFNTREGLPYEKFPGIDDPDYPNFDTSNNVVNYDYDFRTANDSFDIYPESNQHRLDSGNKYNLTLRFDDVDFDSFVDEFNPNGNYLFVKDSYGNRGVKDENRLVINEVSLRSESNDVFQDYNKDGVIDRYDDFIEIINNSDRIINLGRYRIFDKNRISNTNINSLFTINNNNPNYIIPSNTILNPGEVFVVFNHIQTNPLPDFYKNMTGVIIRSAQSNPSNDILSLTSNIEEHVYLTNRFNGVLDFVSNKDITISDDISYSLRRSPELTGNFIRVDEPATPGTYSKILFIQNIDAENFSNRIFPNPFRNELFFTKKIEGNYQIFDIQGKKVQSGNILNNKIDVQNLKKNLYFIKIISNNGQLFTRKIIKE